MRRRGRSRRILPAMAPIGTILIFFFALPDTSPDPSLGQACHGVRTVLTVSSQHFLNVSFAPVGGWAPSILYYLLLTALYHLLLIADLLAAGHPPLVCCAHANYLHDILLRAPCAQIGNQAHGATHRGGAGSRATPDAPLSSVSAASRSVARSRITLRCERVLQCHRGSRRNYRHQQEQCTPPKT